MVPEESSLFLTIHTLGRFEMRQGDTPVAALKLRKARALLVYLLLNPGPHDRGRLAGLLWGDCTEKKAQHNLRQTLWHLRRALPPDLLVENRLTVGLEKKGGVQVDALILEEALRRAERYRRLGDDAGVISHLSRAVALYRGEFLADPDVEDSPEFATWRVGVAAALHELALTAFSQLTRLLLQRGDYEQTLVYARRQLQLEP
jgi:DNA-binding SARP family transcriptional activator